MIILRLNETQPLTIKPQQLNSVLSFELGQLNPINKIALASKIRPVPPELKNAQEIAR